MKERPVIFSAPMVRALLDGTKTQTRRVVRKSEQWPAFAVKAVMLEIRGTAMAVDAWRCSYGPEIKCPYGKPGDRLWVRETWGNAGGGTGFWYRATDDKADDGFAPVGHWKPSIHMPRHASRITLEITGVRVERLQDISEADCWSEGIEQVMYVFDDASQCAMAKRIGASIEDAKPLYAQLWESINGPGSWDENPWVWVIEFKRVAP